MQITNQSNINDFNKTFSVFLQNKKTPYAQIPNQGINPMSSSQNKKTGNFSIKKFLLTGIGMVLAGITAFAIGKSGTNHIHRFVKKTVNHLNSTIFELTNNNKLGKVEQFTVDAYRKTIKFLEQLEGLANAGPLKDQLIANTLGHIPGYNKFANWITDVFVNIGKSSTTNKHKDADYATHEFLTYVKALGKKIENNPNYKLEIDGKELNAAQISESIKEIVGMAQDDMAQLVNGFDNNLSTGSRFKAMRSEIQEKLIPGWKKEFSDLKDKSLFEKLSTFTELITEKVLRGVKANYIKTNWAAKSKITNSPRDLVNTMKDRLDDAMFLVKTDNREARKSYIDLAKLLDEFKDEKMQKAEQIIERNILKQKIEAEFIELSKTLKNSKDSETLKAAEIIDECGTILKEDALGHFEKLSRLCKVFSEDSAEYKKLRELRDIASSKTNIAVNSEAELFDKIRDIEMQSAPADTLFGMVAPIALTGVAVAEADTQDKKISIGLEAGIPAIAGVGTHMIATIKQISGIKAMGFAIAMTFVVNRIGKWVNERYLDFVGKNKKSDKIYV